MLLRKCARVATAVADQRRCVSNRMRGEEVRAQQTERLMMLGGEAFEGKSKTVRKGATMQSLLDREKLSDVKPSQLFHAEDAPSLLETPGELISMLVTRSVNITLDDRWVSALLMNMFYAIKRNDVPVVPAKLAMQTIKTFMNPELPFEVGPASLNALLTIMYQERVDVRNMYEIYGRFQKDSVKPNHQTFALMFNISLRAHRVKNAENFFVACEGLLRRKDFSFAAKTEVVSTLALGIHDSASHVYGIRLIRCLKDVCFGETNSPPSYVPDDASSRGGQHLYISRFVTERVFWAITRCRSAEILDDANDWLSLFESRGVVSLMMRINFMRLLTLNAAYSRAFDQWDQICESSFAQGVAQIPQHDLRNLKSACVHLIESCARSKTPALLERSRKMMEGMISMDILANVSDRVDLYVMQIKLCTLSGEYRKAAELYHAIKKDCKDSRIIRALCSGKQASEKENLLIIKEVFFDFKALAEANDTQGTINMDDALNRYLGVLADGGELAEVLVMMENHVDTKTANVTIETIHQVLTACARDKDARSYGTFYKWNEGGQDSMPLFFSHLKISGTTKQNCVVARGIFDKMTEYGLTPTSKTYNLLIAVYAAAKDHEEVSRLYEELKDTTGLKPDQFSFYYSAKAFADKGMVDMVENTFKELLEESADPKSDVVFTPEVCAMGIRALANSGVSIDTVAYMRSYSTNDEEDWSDEPSSKIHSTKMPRPQGVDMGFDMVGALKSMGLKPGLSVYTALLNLCTRAGDYARAEEVYHMLQADDTDNVLDRSDIVTSLMKMHYMRDNMEDAMTLLAEVAQTDSTALDQTGYHNCLAVCASKGSVVNAKHVIALMFEDQNVKVTDTAISLAVLACAHYKPQDLEEDYDIVDKANHILQEYRDLHKLYRDRVPVVNTQQVFHQVLHVCATAKNADEARRYIQDMKNSNVTVDQLTMAYLAKSLTSTTDIPGFWNQMDRENLEPDIGIVFALLLCCQVARDAHAAIDVLSRRKSLCNEKLSLLFYRILEASNVPKADRTEMEQRFEEVAERSIHDVKTLAHKRALEKAEEAAKVEGLAGEGDEAREKAAASEVDQLFEEDGEDEGETDLRF